MFISIIIICLIQNTFEQYLLGTHFYVNQDNILIDNTLKTVSTLARPYDLVAFIRQAERLARVDHLQTYIDAVDDNDDTDTSSHKQINNEENLNKCNELTRDGESLIFQILQTNLYETFLIPFELKNLSNDYTIHQKKKPTKILTCNHFCQIKTSKYKLLIFIFFESFKFFLFKVY
jgi:hypothetical protein